MSVSTDTRLFRPEAIAAAKAFIAELDGTYDQLVVAGSLRRRLARIGDVEIVAVPKTEQRMGGLLGDVPIEHDLLDERMDALLDAGTVQQRLDVNGHPRWGPLVKYLTYRDVRVDLFCPSAERFGWILLLRTGPAAFSRQLVVAKDRRTKDGRPGLRPVYIATQDGWLTWRTSGQRIPTPTEQHVFDLFGLPYLEPQERT
jgi:DNA polymerase/3'-5' exonuclease PolX